MVLVHPPYIYELDRASFDALPPGPTTIGLRSEGSDIALLCEGELDLASLPDLRRTFLALLRLQPRRVIVDLRSVWMFDCSAIGEIVRARLAFESMGRDLVLRSPSPLGRRVLDMLGLGHLVEGEDGSSAADSMALEVERLVAAWASSCETDLFGGEPVVFADPALLVSTVTRLAADRKATRPPSPDEAIASAVVLADGTRVKIAVRQLLALSHVLQDWAVSATLPDHERADLGSAIEAAVGALVSVTLDAVEHTSLSDPLTGLLNRRALDRDLVRSVAVARRHGRSLTVVTIDIEGLTVINDRLGHSAGDDTVRHVASALTETIRPGDNAYRIGGDEFVLVLPDMHPKDVEGVMRRANDRARGTFAWGSASTGDHDEDLDAYCAGALLELADQRMQEHRTRTRRAGSTDPRSTDWRDPVATSPSLSMKLAGQIQAAARTEIAIEQATGVIAGHLGIDVEAAAELILACARSRQQPVLTIAGMIIGGVIDVAELVALRQSPRSIQLVPTTGADEPDGWPGG